MKKIIYGKTGYGKSYTYIAPIIKESNNVLLITPNGSVENELKYMGISQDYLKEIKVSDMNNITSGKFGILIDHNNMEELNEILDILEKNLSKNDDFTIVLTNTIHYVYRNIELIKRIRGWKCNVICEHTCHSSEEAYEELNLNDRIWHGWVLEPVFDKLY